MPKTTQIVSQHLENISRAALEDYQDIIREYIRGRHGIYALYRKGKLYYVGLATNLRVRLKQHLHDRHKDSWDRFSVYLTIDDRAIKELETLLLRIVAPTGNSAGGRFVRSENLAKKFTADIRKRHNETLYDVVGRTRRKKKAAKKTAESDSALPWARFVDKPIRLRVRFKGTLYRATLRRDGQIRYDGVLYKSPSAAAFAVRGRNTNGWQFWRYERAPGDWVILQHLRK